MPSMNFAEYERKTTSIKTKIEEAEAEAKKYEMLSDQWNYWKHKKDQLKKEKDELFDNWLREQELNTILRYSAVAKAFPKLGVGSVHDKQDLTRPHSIYSVKITTKQADFGILNEFKLEKLKVSEQSLLWLKVEREGDNTLGEYYGENKINYLVYDAINDVLCVAGLINEVYALMDVPVSIFRTTEGNKDRVGPHGIYRKGTKIAGVCLVELPGSNMDNIGQAVDHMLDLRNSFNLRFVFGILSTYEEWRVLWFEDSDIAAKETSKAKYDELCNVTTSNYCHLLDEVSVRMTRVYRQDDHALLELLASVLYKISKSPFAEPTKFADMNRSYVYVTEESMSYKSLPDDLMKNQCKPFKYKFPDSATEFYILKYYRRGRDGRVSLCCSALGELCVLKFLMRRHKEKEILEKEAALWKSLWNTQCRIVKLANRYALLMPFCFHVRILQRRPVFCDISSWNKSPWFAPIPITDDSEVSEFDMLDMEKFRKYQESPELAAREAITKMVEGGMMHSDYKWEHVALKPQYFEETNKYDLVPVLLDLTVTDPFEATTEEEKLKRVEEAMAELSEELEDKN